MILNYRTPDLVCDCLQSLAEERADGVDLEVFIGDASSGDNSIELISSFIDGKNYDWASCFQIGQNGGFAFGNNAIISAYKLLDREFQFVQFLNPDTIARRGSVQSLASFIANRPTVGAVGSRLENLDGSPRASAFRYPAPWREFFRGAQFGLFERMFPRANVVMPSMAQPTRVDWVTGASFMAPVSVLKRVGLMDDAYFLYFEETDLMTRISRSGFEIWHIPASIVVHLAGQSNRNDKDRSSNRVSRYWYISRSIYFLRYYGRFGLFGGTFLFLLGDLFHKIRSFISLKSVRSPESVWRDYMRYSLPAFFVGLSGLTSKRDTSAHG